MSRLTIRYRLFFLIGWPLAVALLALLVPPLQEITREEQEGYLPPEAETSGALRLLERSGFAGALHRSAVVVVLESLDGPMTDAQVAVAAETIRRRSQTPGDPLNPVKDVRSAVDDTALRALLASPGGEAQMILLPLDTVFITRESADAVEAIRNFLDHELPALLAEAGLPQPVRGWLVGDAVLGYDYAQASQESLRRMTLATVILVVSMLLLVYRSPLAPLVSLLTIGMAFVASDRLLSLITLATGIGFSPIVSHFMLVMVFGAGTDYTLFLMGRFREELGTGQPMRDAMQTALGRTSIAIVCSSVTTMLGLGLMCFARFWAFRSLGPAVAFSLGLTLLVALTFAPAMGAVVGRRMFWPVPVAGRHHHKPSRLWMWIGRSVAARPLVILPVVVLAAAPFIVKGAQVKPSYDLMAELPPGSEFRSGFEAVDRLGYPPQRFFPITVAFDSTADPASGYALGPLGMVGFEPGSPVDALRHIAAELLETGAVDSVRSAATPLGSDVQLPFLTAGALERIRETYASPLGESEGRWVGTMDVMLVDADPYGAHAYRDYLDTLALLRQRLAQPPFEAQAVHATGTTVYIADIRHVTTSDFRRVALLVAVGVIGVLSLVTRSVFTPLYLVGTMLLSYLAVMGGLMLAFGAEEIDWKVRFFMLILLIAIGTDYNVFLAMRIREEVTSGRRYPDAVRVAIASTGGIISSCGIIMAGTFASMMLGTLTFLVQLGFAISAGVLLDTFVIRPIVVPSILLVHNRVAERLRGSS